MPRVSESYIRRRRQEIIDAAWPCFARQGFRQTTMDDVAAASGSSPSVIYRWFRSKDDLVNAAIATALSGVTTAMVALREAEPPPSLPQAIDTLLEAVRADTAVPLHAWTEALSNDGVNTSVVGPHRDLLDGLADLVAKQQARGVVDASVKAADLARPLFSLMTGFMLQNLLVGPVDRQRYIESVGVLLQGCRADIP